LSLASLSPTPLSNPIWVHAASVGEVRGISPLISKLLEKNLPLLITTTSDTGKNEAKRLFPTADVCKAPLDIGVIVRRFLEIKKPKLLIINETEIWPSMISQASLARVPIFLVNGRISDNSYPRYLFFRFYFSKILKKITKVLTQSELDKERFLSLGVQSDKISVVGSTKFDQLGLANTSTDNNLEKLIPLNNKDFVITFGSIREEEEELILSVIKKLLEESVSYPLKIIVVPRHPDRFEIFYKKLKTLSAQVLKYSALKEQENTDNRNFEILLVDTIGELLSFYQLASICFVGGTFSKVGGHNLAEPTMFQKPLIIGPEVHSQREAFNIISHHNALIQVDSALELAKKLNYFIKNPDTLQKISINSDNAMSSLTGATNRVMDILEEFL